MKSYPFDRFCREFENAAVPVPPLRFIEWVGGYSLRPEWPPEEQRRIAEAQKRLRAIERQLSVAERLDPRQITSTRRHDIASAVGLTEEEFSCYLHAYEVFADSSKIRSRAWWRDTLLSCGFIAGLLLFLAAVIALAIAVWTMLNS
jgi:hypothetical protein